MASKESNEDSLRCNPTGSQGHDNPSDARTQYQCFHFSPSLLSLPTILVSGKTAISDKISSCEPDIISTDEISTTSSDNGILPTGFPPTPRTPVPSAFTTFAYKRALLNRLVDQTIQVGGKLDQKAYPPCFVHDCMMLPGSLANLLGKVRPQLSYAPHILANISCCLRQRT